MHPYLKYFFLGVFFFLIPTFLHCFPPCLPQLIRGLILIALYALIVMYQHISLVSGLSNKFFFFPPLYTEITVFRPFGIFPDRKQALKCSTGTWGNCCSIPIPAWCGISLVVILACWILLCAAFLDFFFPVLFYFLSYLTFSFHADNFLCFTSPKTSSSGWIKHLAKILDVSWFTVLSSSILDSILLAPVSEYAFCALLYRNSTSLNVK